MSIVDFITSNISLSNGELIAGIELALIIIVVFDFYSLLIQAITSWFKRY